MTLMLVLTTKSRMMASADNDVTKVLAEGSSCNWNVWNQYIRHFKHEVTESDNIDLLLKGRKPKVKLKTLCLNIKQWNSYKGQRKGRVYRIARLLKP